MRLPQHRRIAAILGSVLVLATLVGPWPAVNMRYTDSAYFRDTLARLAVSPGKRSAGPLRAGVAVVPLDPPAPVPTAGYIGQILRPYEGINAPCFARALTIVGEGSSVTILAADLLMVDDRLARAVITRAGLRRDDVYFTATHTHSGPGGWGLHPLERLVAGTYRPELFDYLVDRLAEVVASSRGRTRPVEVAFVRSRVAGLQRNRIIPGGATNDELSAWVFRSTAEPGPPRVLATLATFGAHATVANPTPPRLGGDYPGAFAAALPGLTDAGVVLFAAGTVGDASPARIAAPNHQKAAEAYAQVLAAALARVMRSARFTREVPLGNLLLEVDLPAVEVPCFSTSWRLSPLCTWWIGPRRSVIHAVRLGPACLVGLPGDYAGHLAEELDGAALPTVATSFAGDYKGYLVAEQTSRNLSCYETRVMNFFGATMGEYLTDLARRCVDRLAPSGR